MSRRQWSRSRSRKYRSFSISRLPWCKSSTVGTRRMYRKQNVGLSSNMAGILPRGSLGMRSIHREYAWRNGRRARLRHKRRTRLFQIVWSRRFPLSTCLSTYYQHHHSIQARHLSFPTYSSLYLLHILDHTKCTLPCIAQSNFISSFRHSSRRLVTCHTTSSKGALHSLFTQFSCSDQSAHPTVSAKIQNYRREESAVSVHGIPVQPKQKIKTKVVLGECASFC